MSKTGPGRRVPVVCPEQDAAMLFRDDGSFSMVPNYQEQVQASRHRATPSRLTCKPDVADAPAFALQALPWIATSQAKQQRQPYHVWAGYLKKPGSAFV